MTDDRDRDRRLADALHPSSLDDTADDFAPRRHRTPPVVDTRAIAAEIDRDLPEHFARVVERCAAAEGRATAAYALAVKAEGRWKWPMRVASGLAAFSLGAVTWVLAETRSAGYEARRAEEQRDTVEALKVEVRSIRETLIRFGERLNAWRPVGSVPVIGPHNKDD